MALAAATMVAVLAFPGGVSPAAAAKAGTEVSFGDASGDVGEPRADVTSVRVVREAVHIAIYVTLAQFSDPKSDPAWLGWTGPVVAFDLNNDGAADYSAEWYCDEYVCAAHLYQPGADQPCCSGGVEWDAASRTYKMYFTPSWLQDPPSGSLRVRAAMLWDTDPSDPEAPVLMDEAPDDEWSAAWSYTEPPTPPSSGYWMMAANGYVFPFGNLTSWGSATGHEPAANMTGTASGKGYWAVSKTGSVFAYGDAAHFGGGPALRAGEVIASISATPDGRGYWLFSNQGRVFAFGAAQHFGDMGSTRLNGPVLGSVATPSGHGYYMVASDGGIFSFGDALFRGSMGAARLNAPVMGLAPDPDGLGYWLVASDGGIFAFDATFRGSMGSVRLNRPIVGMVAYGDGYLMVGSDGGIFNFSSKAFAGSMGDNPPRSPIIAVAAVD